MLEINDPNQLIVLPAYGRKYNTIESCEKDWKEGKDFKIYGGPYCSIRDIDTIKADGLDQIVFVISKDLLHYLDI